MRIPSAVLMGLSLLASPPAFSGYDETEWGMKREQVQKLYPGGTSKLYDSKDGRTSYDLQREIVGYSALVQFIFKPASGLYSVTVTFFPAGWKLRPDAPLLPPLKSSEAFPMVKKLRGALEIKYGTPVAASPPPCKATKPLDHFSFMCRNPQRHPLPLPTI